MTMLLTTGSSNVYQVYQVHLLKVPVSQSLMIGLNKLLHLQPHLLSATGLPRLQLHQVHLLLIQATNGEVQATGTKKPSKPPFPSENLMYTATQTKIEGNKNQKKKLT